MLLAAREDIFNRYFVGRRAAAAAAAVTTKTAAAAVNDDLRKNFFLIGKQICYLQRTTVARIPATSN